MRLEHLLRERACNGSRLANSPLGSLTPCAAKGRIRGRDSRSRCECSGVVLVGQAFASEDGRVVISSSSDLLVGAERPGTVRMVGRRRVEVRLALEVAPSEVDREL